MLKDIMTAGEADKLRQLIDNASSIAICAHVSPDGDAIGSSLGWANYLESLGKEPMIIVPDQFPDFLKWMPGTEKIVRYDKHKDKADLMLKTADLIFCLDLNMPSRMEDMEGAFLASKAKKVLIDHHLEPDIEAEVSVSHPEKSSTSELVFRVVWQLGGFEQLNRLFAAPIYCGMMTDTGGFTYNSSDPEIYFIISELLTKGIDKDKIYRNVFNTYSESRLRLIGYVLNEKMVVDPVRHASYYALTKEEMKRFHFVKGDAEGLVNMPLQIKGLKLSVSLREDTEKENMVWVSLRSVDDFPCNQVAAEFFNGGGHLNASGGRLYCSIQEAEEITKQAFKFFENSLK
jgi:phosphoesterase RecJ-like protein